MNNRWFMVVERNYYEILGISRFASFEEIDDSYRKLVSHIRHDHADSSYAADRLREIDEAYSVLSDSEKRRRYDQHVYEYMTKQPSRSSSPLWYLLPIFLGIIGGVVAYFVLRNNDYKRAKYCLYIGMVMMGISIFLNFVLLPYANITDSTGVNF